MKREQAANYRDPHTGNALELRIDEQRDGEIIRGALVSADRVFPIVRGIPRFCPMSNYADSFGFQWQKYARTQLDSHASWQGHSEERFFSVMRCPRNMPGVRILEAGSGMGRFTEVVAATGAEVCTFDYTQAVDANRENNSRFDNVSFAQADIFNPPYEPESFDRVFCFGVLQHTPSPRKAFLSLTRFLKPGGSIACDVYRLDWRCFLLGKYYLRPVTTLMPARRLHRFVEFHVGWVYPLTGMVHRLVGRRGRTLAWMLGMADYRGVFDAGMCRELSVLDTFDALAPAYDRPQTKTGVRRWCRQAGLVDIDVCNGYNGIEIRARQPLR